MRFNPRSRVGSDAGLCWALALVCMVSIHAPVWGATVGFSANEPDRVQFQSTLPCGERRATARKGWRNKTACSKPDDWIFASPYALGKRPYWPDAVLKRHVRPAAERAGIAKTIGWHSFRRTLATLLHSSGASVKTTQDLLRHSSPMMTLGVYAKAVTATNERLRKPSSQ
jgi:integrase